MAAVLDDLDTRPGSATSLLRTVIGGNLRAQGGWMATASLVALMAALDVPDDRTRTALTRLKAKGMLVPELRDRVTGYALAQTALPMLERGDRRIYNPRLMQSGDRWCLISFSVPEQQRNLRHQLRRRLGWIGCGTVAPALWICPEYLAEEVQLIVDELGLTQQVTVFLANEVCAPSELQQAVSRWWDLAAIGALHERFVAGCSGAVESFRMQPTPRTAFSVWMRALDGWRAIPYLDPGLPVALLPAEWPGNQSVPLFLELRESVMPVAAQFVEAVLSGEMAPGAATGPPLAGRT